MNQGIKAVLVILIVCLIAFPVLAYLGYQPFASWGQQIYGFFTGLNIGKIPATIGALIGGTGISAGAAVAVGYAYTKIKGALKQTQSTLTSTQAQVTTLSGEKTQLSGQLTQAQADAQTQLTKAQADAQAKIDAATIQANTYKNQAETAEETIKRQAIEKETLTKQNIANFTQSLPGNSVVMDPSTGNMIKTMEKVIVK